MKRWAITLLLSALFLGHWTASANDVSRIPASTGELLSGPRVALPDSFAGKRGVLIIGFSQGSREQVAAWGRRLAPEYHDSHEISYFEVGEFAGVPRLLRGWILKKVKASVPERAQSHFLVLTDHEAEWKEATGFGPADDAYVLVVDATGRVLWKTHGASTDEAYAALRQRLHG